MIISVNWLKKFTDIDLPIDELVTLIGARLVEIESVSDLGAKYNSVLVAKVVEAAPLAGSDHLSLTKIDDGGVAKDVDRDENGLVQVVCGAPNVRAGLLVAWLPPSSTVPSTFGDAEPFVLVSKSLRGVISHGMLASAKELDLFDDQTGILEIDKPLEPGTSFATGFELDDYLLDIENKSLTHRPDTFGIVGFAREVAAIIGQPFVTPEWLLSLDPVLGDKVGDIATPAVSIDDPKLSARYQAVVLGDVDSNRQSPLEIQTYLARVGVRPINTVVDITNYLMMLTGQPLHAFDYDKLVAVSGGKVDIHVRSAREGEKLELLDGRNIVLTAGDIVVAAGEAAVALAGAMGGASTAIDATTKTIIIESATFNLYNLRATQMRYGIFSEAITRFTKGQPAALTAPVLASAIRLLSTWAGAKRVSDIAQAISGEDDNAVIEVSPSRINRVLGTSFETEAIEKILKAVEFAVKAEDTNLSVRAPYWRCDIHIAEDIIEEIGRLNGFDSIVPTLPSRDFRAVKPTAFDEFRTSFRKLMVRAGANEVLTYSFVHGDVLAKAGQNVADSYRITNSISPDLQYYRQSLTPSLLGLIHPNVKQGNDNFGLFEVNKSHPKPSGLNQEAVPIELDTIALTLTDNKAHPNSAYYQAKRLLDYASQSLGLNLHYKPMAADIALTLAAPFEHRRSATISDDSGEIFGIVGEYKKTVARAFKLPEFTAGFEIESLKLFEAVQRLGNGYTPLSKYPSTSRDICFQLSDDLAYGQIIDVAKSVLRSVELETSLVPVDIYHSEDAATKNITIRLRLTSHSKTLTAEEVNQVVSRVCDAVTDQLSAKVV